MVTVCVAPRRSIRKERAEKRSGDYGRGPATLRAGAWARPEGRRFPADSVRQAACPMPRIALRAFPTLSAGKRRADHDHGEKAGLAVCRTLV